MNNTNTFRFVGAGIDGLTFDGDIKDFANLIQEAKKNTLNTTFMVINLVTGAVEGIVKNEVSV